VHDHLEILILNIYIYSCVFSIRIGSERVLEK
jgi:hypothetical protein